MPTRHGTDYQIVHKDGVISVYSGDDITPLIVADTDALMGTSADEGVVERIDQGASNSRSSHSLTSQEIAPLEVSDSGANGHNMVGSIGEPDDSMRSRIDADVATPRSHFTGC
jgi:hypothetical protein